MARNKGGRINKSEFLIEALTAVARARPVPQLRSPTLHPPTPLGTALGGCGSAWTRGFNMEQNLAAEHLQKVARASIGRVMRMDSDNSLELDEDLFSAPASAGVQQPQPEAADADTPEADEGEDGQGPGQDQDPGTEADDGSSATAKEAQGDAAAAAAAAAPSAASSLQGSQRKAADGGENSSGDEDEDEEDEGEEDSPYHNFTKSGCQRASADEPEKHNTAAMVVAMREREAAAAAE